MGDFNVREKNGERTIFCTGCHNAVKTNNYRDFVYKLWRYSYCPHCGEKVATRRLEGIDYRKLSNDTKIWMGGALG